MFRNLVVAAFLLLAAAAFAETAEQTDWSGGDGVEGPVTDWGDTFDTATDINWSGLRGRVILSCEVLDSPIEHTVAVEISMARSVKAADVDGDGDTDILGASFNSDYVCWWENVNGLGITWIRHTVATDMEGASSIFTADVDDDGDIDVVCSASYDDEITWCENVDGIGTIWIEHLVDGDFEGAFSVHAADVNGDDYIDILGAASRDDKITWWENIDGSGSSWIEHSVDDSFDGARSVFADDVDGDGDIDVLGAAREADDIVWWENLDGSGTSWTEHLVDGDFDGAISVCTADVDGDDDTDVLGAAIWAGDITWWENTNGLGTNWSEHTVDGHFPVPFCVHASDVDGDGDTDVLGVANDADDITWWENADGTGGTWIEHTVNGDFNGASSVYTADVDGDSKIDILGSANLEDRIAWWEVLNFKDSGELTSSILDTEGGLGWGLCTWDDDVPTDTSLTVEARAADDPGAMGDWVEITEGDLSDYLPDGLRYIQYRVGMESATGEATPTFNWIKFTWSNDSSVDDVDIFATSDDGGVLVSWAITGDLPIGIQVLREVDGEIIPLHTDLLPGSAKRYLDNGVEPGIEYHYWLEVTESDGTVSLFGPTEAVLFEPEGNTLNLSVPYPSPAHDVVTISYTLPNDCSVELAVYDLSGRRVATLVSSDQTAGRHEVSWSCADVESGVYLYRLETKAGSITQRLVISR